MFKKIHQSKLASCASLVAQAVFVAGTASPSGGVGNTSISAPRGAVRGRRAVMRGVVAESFAISFGRPLVECTRCYQFSLLLLGATLLCGTSLVFLLPLKQTVPYLVTVDSIGKVTPVGEQAAGFKPGRREYTYFLWSWTRDLMVIGEESLETQLARAYARVRRTAAEQFKNFIQADQPVRRRTANDLLRRGVEPVSVVFSDAGAGTGHALVRFRATEYRGRGADGEEHTYTLSIQFVTQPSDDPRETYTNPLGLYVVSFELVRDLAT